MTVKNLQLELSLRIPEKYCGRKFQYFEFCGFLYLNCIPVYCNRQSLSFDNIRQRNIMKTPILEKLYVSKPLRQTYHAVG